MRKLAVIFISIIGVVLLAGVLGISCAKSTPSITTSSLPDGTVNIAYSQTLAASGGSGTYTNWAITSGALPAELSIASSTGVISGTSTTAGTSSFTVQVTDSKGATGSANLSITIQAAPIITTTSLPNGKVNIAYAQTLTASGGSGTYTTWAITSGALPGGLSLISSTGIISGTSTTAGTSSFTVQVTDSKGVTGSLNLSITIAAS
jgi:hypothetical protein